MTKASTPQSATIPRLKREAALLQNLYKAYLSDRRFLSTPGARILAFVDSHEIKAYIDPDEQGSLTGFVMHLENVVMQSETAAEQDRHRTTVGLRHDQILSGFLFDPSRVCGILPSHAAEMDREIAFRVHRWFDTMLGLVEKAQDEIRRNSHKARQISKVAENEPPEGKRDFRHLIVKFFETHAPAVTAILNDNLFTPQKRLQAVLENSRVALFEDIRWADFDVKPHVIPRLHDLKTSLEQRQEMQKKLRTFEYRKNTVAANIVDAAALAHMAQLRRELDLGGADHLRVVLVSRARTLLRAAADLAAQDGTELLVRHPRMLALAGRNVDRLDEATDLALGTALDVWQSQLENHPKPEPGQEEDGLSSLEPAKAFLATWDTFERSRLAVEAKWRQRMPTTAKPSAEGEIAEQLLALFCDANPEAILKRTLIDRFNKFTTASSRFLLETGQLRLPVRLTKPAGGRVYVTPVVMGAVGPIQVADWEGSPPSGAALSLEEIASKVSTEAERPLIWSLALACAGRWKQAAIFARSAQQLADLEDDHDTADEGRLLRAEIRRLGATAPIVADRDDDDRPPEVRYERSLKDLGHVRPVNQARRLREEAAQLLEAALAGAVVPDFADKLRDCFTRLDVAADNADGNESKARFIALLLMLHLYDVRYCSDRPALLPEQRRRAGERHKDLVKVFNLVQGQGHIDTMPHRARAMEVIGYVLPGGAPEGQRSRTSANKPRPGNIPDTLRGELPDLLKGLEVSSDKIAGFLKDEIKTILELLRPLHSPELLLAPVPPPQSAIDQLRERHPDLADKIAMPLACLETVGDSLLTRGPSPDHERSLEQAIGDLEAVIVLGSQRQIDGKQMFHLRSALLYARLLDATLEAKHVREQRFDELIRQYQALSRDYPDATLPHVRVGYLAEKIGRLELECQAITDALKLVDADRYYTQEAGGPHWLQSFVRRRHASIVLRNIPDAKAKWSGDPASPEASEQVRALTEACSILLDAEQRDVAPGSGRAIDLDRRRRINNIVYYGSRLTERTGSEDAFNGLSPKMPLAAFVDRLMPAGVEELDDIDFVHTIGCYHAAVANMTNVKRVVTASTKEARRAAEHIFRLMSVGKNMASRETAEAHGWLTAGQQAEPMAASA
jgi:hypothetical protein